MRCRPYFGLDSSRHVSDEPNNSCARSSPIERSLDNSLTIRIFLRRKTSSLIRQWLMHALFRLDDKLSRGAWRPLRYARALDCIAICAASLRSEASPAHPVCGSSISSRHVEYAVEYFTSNATSADMGRKLLMFVW